MSNNKRTMTPEHKAKMQAAREAKKQAQAAAAAANPEQQAAATPGNGAPLVFKVKVAKKKEILAKIRISRNTPLSSLLETVEANIAEMRKAGLNPSRIGGSLRVY